MAKKKTAKAEKKQKIQPSKTGSAGGEWMLVGIVLGITMLLFANTLGHQFVNWDDPLNLLENPNLDGFTWDNIVRIFTPSTGVIIGNYNPLPIFMFAIEKAMFGVNPAVFHLNNVLLHLVCVFFVFRILRAMNLGVWAAALGALLFGIHPMRVESVAWITERKDVLFGAFYFAALFTYIRWLQRPEERAKWFWATLILFFISLFSKIQAVALPLSMLALDYYFRRPLNFKLVVEKIPFFALSLLFGLAGVYFLNKYGSLEDETDYTFAERLLVGAYTYCVYFVKWIFPYQMSPLYPYTKTLPTLAYVAPAGVLAIAGWGTWAFRKEKIAIVFGLLFFTFNVMFVLQVLGAGQGYLADRFTYVGYFGLFFLMAWAYETLLKKFQAKKLLIEGGITIYLLLLAVLTFQQNKVWKNGETLWTHAAKEFPETDTPYQNLGKYYQSFKQNDKAMENFSKAITVALNPAISYNSRGKLYFDSGQADKALADFDAAVKAGTKIGEIYINRGSANAQLQRYQQAMEDFNEGIKLDPESKQGYLMRALLHFTNRNFGSALADMQKVTQLDPNNADAWYEAGLSLNNLGRHQEAVEHISKAISLNPNQKLYFLERARAYRVLGKDDLAVADEQRANSMR